MIDQQVKSHFKQIAAKAKQMQQQMTLQKRQRLKE